MNLKVTLNIYMNCWKICYQEGFRNYDAIEVVGVGRGLSDGSLDVHLYNVEPTTFSVMMQMILIISL